MRERVNLKSPVRENRSPGSVRRASGNRRPYLDRIRFGEGGARWGAADRARLMVKRNRFLYCPASAVILVLVGLQGAWGASTVSGDEPAHFPAVPTGARFDEVPMFWIAGLAWDERLCGMKTGANLMPLSQADYNMAGWVTWFSFWRGPARAGGLPIAKGGNAGCVIVRQPGATLAESNAVVSWRGRWRRSPGRASRFSRRAAATCRSGPLSLAPAGRPGRCSPRWRWTSWAPRSW